jgi:hypothetical protein
MSRRSRCLAALLVTFAGCDPAELPADAGRDSGTSACADRVVPECFGSWPDCCDEGSIGGAICNAGDWQCPAGTRDHCDCLSPPDAGPDSAGALIDCVGEDYYYIDDDADALLLRNCRSLGGTLQITDSAEVTDLSPLSNLTSIGGSLQIRRQTGLTDLDGLHNLVSIGGYFELRDNSALANVSGLGALAWVGGYFEIRDNGALTSLDGLNELRAIGGYFEIDDNAVLSSVEALGALSIEEYLEVQRNPMLPACQAEAAAVRAGVSCSCSGNTGAGTCD